MSDFISKDKISSSNYGDDIHNRFPESGFKTSLFFFKELVQKLFQKQNLIQTSKHPNKGLK